MMTSKEKISKYDALFQSGVEIVSRVGLCNRKEVVGATDEEINEFSVKHGITLPASVWSYFRWLGQSSQLNNGDYNVSPSLQDYDYALHQANLKEDWLAGGMNLKEYINTKNFKVNYDDEIPEDNDGIYTPEINSLMDINDIVFCNYDPFTRTFEFFNSRQENPIVYAITAYKNVTTLFSPFTDRFRNVLFMTFVDLISEKKSSFSSSLANADLSGELEYIKTYKELFQNSNELSRARLKSCREMFCQMNSNHEKEENRVLSISEFENGFINFLSQNNFGIL